MKILKKIKLRVKRNGIQINEKMYFSNELLLNHYGEVVNVVITTRNIMVYTDADVLITTFTR